jgi:hypothetical protein
MTQIGVIYTLQFVCCTTMTHHVLYPSSSASSTTTLPDISGMNSAYMSAVQTLAGWVPPASPLDWDFVNVHLRRVALDTGFKRYNQWHHRVLIHQAEGKEKSADGGSGVEPMLH